MLWSPVVGQGIWESKAFVGFVMQFLIVCFAFLSGFG